MEWSDSGYILKVELSGLADILDVGYKLGAKEEVKVLD